MKRDINYYLDKADALMAREPMPKVRTPLIIMDILRADSRREEERFYLITLDGSHIPIKKHTITIGIANQVMIHPREVFKTAIKDNATAIIIIHNHPSGNIQPSQEDINVTERIKKAGEIIGIQLLDSMIISKDKYYSFMEESKL